MTFGEKIKALRDQRGMTLEQVGDLVGVGKSTVRKWESGQIANMRRDKIALLAKALGVTPGFLMGWEDEDAQQAREDLAEDPDRKALLDFARYGTAQEVRAVVSLIDTFKATNPDEYDGDDPA